MALWTNAGLNLIASAVQSPGVNCAITEVGLSPGCGTLSSAIPSGTPVTALPINSPGIPAALGTGQGLTVTDGVHSETVVVASGGAAQNATSIPINSWTPLNSYAANTAGVCPTPAVGDIALYGESVRVGANVGSAGASAGESLNSGYFDGTQATAVYLSVGYFGGSTATGTTGTGTLMGEDIQYWNHVQNQDSNMFQADDKI